MTKRIFFSFPILLLWIVGSSAAELDEGPGPFSAVPSDDRQSLEEIVRTPTLYREIKGIKFRSRKEIYDYLLDHPEFAAGVARALKLADYEITKEQKAFHGAKDSYRATDTRGITGHFQVIHAGGKKRVFFLVGTYHRNWLPVISAKAVVFLLFDHKADGEETYAENDLRVYVKIDNRVIALLTRLLQAAMGRVMESRMKEVLAVAGTISEEIYRDPDGFLRKLETNSRLSRQELDGFRRILHSRA